MDADHYYKIVGKRWYPRFKNDRVEQEFMAEFNLRALNSGRIAIAIAVIVWSGFALFDLHLESPARESALFFRLLITAPVLMAVFALLYSKYAVGLYQYLVCLALLIIEGSLCYVVKFYDLRVIADSLGFVLPMGNSDGKCIFLFAWLMVIFMSSVSIRLGVLPSIICGLMFVFFSLVSIFIYQPSAVIVMIQVPFFIASLPVVWIESLNIARYARENYRSRNLLLKYLSPQLTTTIYEWEVNRVWKYARRKLTLFFSDIKNFTEITDSMEPEDMAGLLNEYLTCMDGIIKKYNGTLIQMMGDGLFVIFGAPGRTSDRDHALRCVKMALEMQEAMCELNSGWFDKGVDEHLKIRCGINTGMATVGGYGSSERKAYTAMGMQVNVAARLEQACEPGKILISHSTRALVKDEIQCTEKGRTAVKGYHKQVLVYDVIIESPGMG